MINGLVKTLLFSLCASTSFACNCASYPDRIGQTDSSEYGYIFMTDQTPVSLFSVSNDHVDIISESNNIYRADSLADIEQFTSINNISVIARDCPVELYDYQDEDWYSECGINACFDLGITGKGVKVAVVDTGIFAEHDAFTDNEIADGANICAYLDKASTRYSDVSDPHGHGTAVASVISQIATEATLVPLKIYDENSRYSLTASSVLTAMQYALTYDIDIINFSAGFSNPSDELLQIANKLTANLAENGTIMIAATGNRGDSDNRAEYPASCDKVIGVGAVQKSGGTYVRSSFSTANESILVTAPGYGIWCADISGADTYLQKDGTSFSAPVVTALAAGIKQLQHNTNPEQFTDLLITTSADLDRPGYDIYTGYGLVDYKKVYAGMNPITCIMCVYNADGILTDIKIENNYIPGNGLPEPNINPEPSSSIRYLFWDGLDSMRPVDDITTNSIE